MRHKLKIHEPQFGHSRSNRSLKIQNLFKKCTKALQFFLVHIQNFFLKKIILDCACSQVEKKYQSRPKFIS